MRAGAVNRILLKLPESAGQESAWGWSTGNNAIAVNRTSIFIANTGRKLLRFSWAPGDLESAQFVLQKNLSADPVGLASRGTTVAIVFATSIELRRTSDLAVLRTFAVANAKDVAVAADGSLWVLAENKVRHYSAHGVALGSPLAGISKPVALAFDHVDRLIVCDDGPDQQVKFFTISPTGKPSLAATFGDQGGISSGVPGKVEPKKLFSLRGAGTDAVGNLYVAMSFATGPVGNLHLRSFTPAGKLRWQLVNAAFVDTFGFDPAADGSVIYSRNAVFHLDLAHTQPGAEWSLRALTVDPILRPSDPRISGASSVHLRRLQGKSLLYTIGQYAGGFDLFTFDETNGWIAKLAGAIHADDKWAWDVAANGEIWHGDADGRRILRYAFKGWKKDGTPDFDWANPQSWPWPDDFALVRRVIYDAAADALYLFGYLYGQDVDSWGVVGKTGRRYNGWLAGPRQLVWTKSDLPVNPTGSETGGPLTPNSVALAGDYLFLGMVKPDDGRQYTHILTAQNADYVGSLWPGTEVGGNAGWQDMPYAVQALRRANGEYLILVEEDWRGKNLLYRWMPKRIR